MYNKQQKLVKILAKLHNHVQLILFDLEFNYWL